MTNEILNHEYAQFLAELKNRVASSRYQAARVVNNELILFVPSYWYRNLKTPRGTWLGR